MSKIICTGFITMTHKFVKQSAEVHR